jgi:hypothetical protein
VFTLTPNATVSRKCSQNSWFMEKLPSI